MNPTNQPNIVYIHSHDTGRYISPYGYDVPTPRLQRLAEEGVLFRQAFCAAPTCSPSRAALLTGQWAHSSGMLGLAHRGFRLHDNRQHLANTLKAAGYTTVLTGMQHVAPGAENDQLGYDRFQANPNTAEEIASAFLRSRPAGPFFLDVGFMETHRIGIGFGAEERTPGSERYVRPPAPLPDTAETRRDMADYMTAAARMDRKIGVVLDALDEAGFAENTLVVCTTDHGMAFPRMKCSLTDSGIGVMMILRGPGDGDGGFVGGKVVDAMVSQIDLFPTLCDVIGIERPQWLQGVSLLPLLAGTAEEVRDELFAEVTFHAAYEPKRAVRTRRYKYIRNYSPWQQTTLPNCDDSPSKDLLMAHGWGDNPVASEELYDLFFDPYEANDLSQDATSTSALAGMRDRLDRWMQGTDDPLLQGPLLSEALATEGFRVTPLDAVSPGDPAVSWAEERARLQSAN